MMTQKYVSLAKDYQLKKKILLLYHAFQSI